ncbi:TetR family transcriptional regulator [Streptomyces dioscori]|uniref:TetR family transcriptional regulator n=1 Tax=Streptomyces dioscori TaxID=2109333 RepID=A0A2P8PY96_9ACTN|nr:TetR/AcrR family transcriptional regulator [Streptomyces dioscori]PSM38976.1 TetR family transcriptional regulator [Streptomyces dioscori]
MARTNLNGRPSDARSRLLSTACRIFYEEGIHSVGVDRIVTEAQVTRATFYRHFPSKEDLVLAYLDESHRAEREQAEAALAAELSAADALRRLSRSIAQRIQVPGFRGCAFLNAVAEYPDPDHPVHQAVLAHRQWFLQTVAELLAKVREAPAEAAAHHFVMMRDGATAAGCLFDPSVVCETFLRGVDVLLRAHVTAPYSEPDRVSAAGP